MNSLNKPMNHEELGDRGINEDVRKSTNSSGEQ